MTKDEFAYIFTTNLEQALLNGYIPWQCPWDKAQNGSTGRPYSGMNQILLNIFSHEFFSDNPNFYTIDQANKLGSKVKKGSKSLPVFFFQTSYKREIKDEAGNPVKDEKGKKTYEIIQIPPVFKIYNVFNALQLTPVPPVAKHDPKLDEYNQELADKLIALSPSKIIFDASSGAFFSPKEDVIVTPPKERFSKNPQAFYSTVFHEMAHSTGTENRLHRNLKNRFGSHDYAVEELVAEFASLALCDSCNMRYTNQNSQAYIRSWIEVIKNPSFKIFDIFNDSQRATTYLQHPEKREELHEQAENRITRQNEWKRKQEQAANRKKAATDDEDEQLCQESTLPPPVPKTRRRK